MNTKHVSLKAGKEKAIRNKHHWIFSGAVKNSPEFENGDILTVSSSDGTVLGSAYFNRKSSIIGRMVSFDAAPPLEAIQNHLDAAIALRTKFFSNTDTNAYRLVNGEGDLLPGLVIDRYDDVLVVQFSTLGMDRLRAWIVDYLTKKMKPRSIFEKSQQPSRQEEGLQPVQKTLMGPDVSEIEIKENGLRFKVSLTEGQKTGFFLDHREMRQWMRSLASSKKVLNCFSYTGGFSVYALAGGATKVDSVDISEKAIEWAKQNVILNGFDATKQGFYAADVFKFLREEDLNYDLIILDPPAFAKRRKDVIQGCRGYKDINRIAMQKMPKNSILLTSSCSYFVDESLFRQVVFQAAVEAQRTVRIIGTHRMAIDHPVNICHPEGDYLKSFLLYVE
jgi:23S rRNA (cytosine1962-C5)-methyltransferase